MCHFEHVQVYLWDKLQKMGIQCGLNDGCTYNFDIFCPVDFHRTCSFFPPAIWGWSIQMCWNTSSGIKWWCREQVWKHHQECDSHASQQCREPTVLVLCKTAPQTAVRVTPAHWCAGVWLAWVAVHPPGCPGRVSCFNPPAAALAEKAFWETKRIQFILENLVSLSKPLVN